MSCNCGTTEQIQKLYDDFGIDRKKERKTTSQWIEWLIQGFFLVLCMIPITIYLFIYILNKKIKGEDISISKFFKLKKENMIINEREQ